MEATDGAGGGESPGLLTCFTGDLTYDVTIVTAISLIPQWLLKYLQIHLTLSEALSCLRVIYHNLRRRVLVQRL